ncbi:MAG: hypothetical protein OEZ39_14140 [Gammaproteobacteria bacterium]|nr:hypothetical protein [Gammaproteobacteria bacterium]MDH5652992.1 hypothetical protein [Gammaproteobacteria bacterium]
MGWLFTKHASKSDIIRHLISPEENETRRREILAHCVRGKVLWLVIEITQKQTHNTQRFIGCCLLATEKGFGWGYKDMQESEHPFYYSCPLKYLEMVPEANAEWRTKVRKHHRQQNRKVEIGQKIGIINSTIPWVVIMSRRPLVGEYDGKRYRVPRRMLGDVLN